MTRLAFALIFLLCTGCIPAFSNDTTDQLRLGRQGDAYTLYSSAPIERASVGVRAGRVESLYCVPVSCQKDAEDRVLLVLPSGVSYGPTVALGRFEGLQRARLVVVQVGGSEALVKVVEQVR